MKHKRFNTPFELKKLEEGGVFEGYASVFGVKDHDGDVIVKGAFKSSLERIMEGGKRPKMLWQHNPSIIIGKWIDMHEDDHGLYVRGTLFTDIEKGAEAYALMKHGELDAMSVGFNINNAYSENRDRVIDDLDLWEISVVTWGANPEALVSSVKSIETERDFEQFLRDSGFSQKEAKRITAEGFKTAETVVMEVENQRDVDQDVVDGLKALLNELSNKREIEQ